MTGSAQTATRRSLILILLVLSFPLLVSHEGFAKDDFRARSLTSCEGFPSNDAIGDIFAALAEQHSEIARELVIGASVLGREIHALRLSADPEVESEEPEARIIGAIHGNECMGADIVLSAAEWMIAEYETDPVVTGLVDNAELVFVPLLNPDGYTAETATRENDHGVDLNRNLHFAWTGGGPEPFSEPETRALRALSQENSFTLGISYHTVSYYVNASWNYTPHHPPDEALFQTIGEAYAGKSAFLPVFGWDWYDIQGDVNDWSLGTQGTFDWTLELMSDLDSQWEINRAGLIAFLSFMFQGVEGRVIDAATGAPLAARIDIDPAGAPVFTDPDVGDYHRILLPGRYSLRAVAEGYAPQEKNGIEVLSEDTVTVDFALEKDWERPGYAFAVNGMSMPKRVARTRYDVERYPNDTMVWDVLGEPDGIPYSLSADPDSLGEAASSDLDRPVGAVTLDMGEATPVTDIEGYDLLVVSAFDNGDAAAVLLSDDQDGPFVEATRGTGTMAVDLGAAGFETARYVRVVDLNDDAFDTPNSGYDLDAVVNLSVGAVDPDAGLWPPLDSGGPDPDAGASPPDAGDEEDSGDDGPTILARSGGCTCRVAEKRVSLRTMIFHLLKGE